MIFVAVAVELTHEECTRVPRMYVFMCAWAPRFKSTLERSSGARGYASTKTRGHATPSVGAKLSASLPTPTYVSHRRQQPLCGAN